MKAKGRELNSLSMPTHTDMANDIALPDTATNAMQNFTQEYTYDELGNMMQLKSVGQWTRDYFYNFSQNNYLLGHTDGQTDYTYDAHGNMLSMPHLQAMHWDYNDWLTAVDLDATGNKANYVYDSAGERVRKVVEKGNIKEERLYFGDYEIYRKFVSGVLETERTTVAINDDKSKIATVDALTVDQSSLTVNPVAVIRYQYDNQLGSASLELDETADIISYEEYHPFGTTSYRSGRTETETSLKRYKYVGKERDEETGLYYYGFRYYAAWLCRFVSVDPLQFEYPHYTPFQYAGNKPITYIDLDGLEEAKGKYDNNILDDSLEYIGVDLGYEIWVNDKTFEFHLEKKDVIIEEVKENNIIFYLRKITLYGNTSGLGDVNIKSLEETRLKYNIYRTSNGRLFTDNGKDINPDYIKGVFVNNKEIDKFETIYPVSYFDNNQIYDYINKHDKLISSFITLVNKQPYLVSSGNLKYRKYEGSNFFEFTLKFYENFLKNDNPISATFEKMIEDVDFNLGVKYNIKSNELDEAINYFESKSKQDKYYPVKEL